MRSHARWLVMVLLVTANSVPCLAEELDPKNPATWRDFAELRKTRSNEYLTQGEVILEVENLVYERPEPSPLVGSRWKYHFWFDGPKMRIDSYETRPLAPENQIEHRFSFDGSTWRIVNGKGVVGDEINKSDTSILKDKARPPWNVSKNPRLLGLFHDPFAHLRNATFDELPGVTTWGDLTVLVNQERSNDLRKLNIRIPESENLTVQYHLAGDPGLPVVIDFEVRPGTNYMHDRVETEWMEINGPGNQAMKFPRRVSYTRHMFGKLTHHEVTTVQLAQFSTAPPPDIYEWKNLNIEPGFVIFKDSISSKDLFRWDGSTFLPHKPRRLQVQVETEGLTVADRSNVSSFFITLNLTVLLAAGGLLLVRRFLPKKSVSKWQP